MQNIHVMISFLIAEKWWQNVLQFPIIVKWSFGMQSSIARVSTLNSFEVVPIIRIWIFNRSTSYTIKSLCSLAYNIYKQINMISSCGLMVAFHSFTFYIHKYMRYSILHLKSLKFIDVVKRRTTKKKKHSIVVEMKFWDSVRVYVK